MEWLIFSDSHGNEDNMHHALAQQPRIPHGVCFLGDGLKDIDRLPLDHSILYTVRGNCDWDCSSDGIPNERSFCAEGHTILLTHGHLHGVKSGCAELATYAANLGADIVLFGHTHQPSEMTYPAGQRFGTTVLTRPLYLLNPGSIRNGNFGTLFLQKETVLFAVGQTS